MNKVIYLYGQGDTLTEALLPRQGDPLFGKIPHSQILKGLLCLEVKAHGCLGASVFYLQFCSKFPPKVIRHVTKLVRLVSFPDTRASWVGSGELDRVVSFQIPGATNIIRTALDKQP